MCPFLWVLPRSCCGQCSGGHFSTDANSVQRKVRSCKKPEAAAPCTAWNLYLILRQGLSLTEGTWYTKLSQGRVQAGSRCRTEDWKPLKHPPHVHDHPSCFVVHPFCVQHLTFYFCIGNNLITSLRISCSTHGWRRPA